MTKTIAIVTVVDLSRKHLLEHGVCLLTHPSLQRQILIGQLCCQLYRVMSLKGFLVALGFGVFGDILISFFLSKSRVRAAGAAKFFFGCLANRDAANPSRVPKVQS
eukprot:6468209-Amphidinium_carterae.2